jgi:hypothetical protein
MTSADQTPNEHGLMFWSHRFFLFQLLAQKYKSVVGPNLEVNIFDAPDFAPEERYVYRPELSNTVAQLGAKMLPSSCPLRSFGARVRYRIALYKHLAPPEQS